MKSEFQNIYRIRGGYPGLLNLDYKSCALKLSETFWLGFHKDLVLSKSVGDPAGMRDLIEYIASISSHVSNYSSLREKSGATTNTEQTKKYLYHLQNAYLVGISNKYNNKKYATGYA